MKKLSKGKQTTENFQKYLQILWESLENEWTGWAGEIEVDTRDTEELVVIEVISKLLLI
ncbi:hypothetical protein [Clostridium aciditolerans]|uniref:Uncharacterized protein n=1 Tax=Clostridium aciditolerans TaxID=339861 RepID=A0A934HXD8_9CLOT|nr:hypothetical protein [Clostridium aciditolerans]MBI6872327.1 hypothetical protein [Clostridium aciditolerans]